MTTKYRRLGTNNEPAMGRGLQDFLTDIDAVAQAVITNLRLFYGEWWENLNLGLPMWQKILGVPGSQKDSIDILIKACVENTKGVNSVSNISSTFNSTTRAYEFYCEIETIYGTTIISNQGEIQ